MCCAFFQRQGYLDKHCNFSFTEIGTLPALVMLHLAPIECPTWIFSQNCDVWKLLEWQKHWKFDCVMLSWFSCSCADGRRGHDISLVLVYLGHPRLKACENGLDSAFLLRQALGTTLQLDSWEGRVFHTCRVIMFIYLYRQEWRRISFRISKVDWLWKAVKAFFGRSEKVSWRRLYIFFTNYNYNHCFVICTFIKIILNLLYSATFWAWCPQILPFDAGLASCAQVCVLIHRTTSRFSACDKFVCVVW